tara:strand:+ start:162 stop:374 length:213 start_codon:yes stop_codon:yes gene_type:complete
MIVKLKKEAPGFYKVMVNNYNRFNIRKRKIKGESGGACDWTVHDLTYKKKYIDFVSLREAKDFIKNEIFS